MEQWNSFLETVGENLTFLAVVFLIAAGLIGLAYGLERMIAHKSGVAYQKLSVRKMAVIGMMAAIAMILMWFEFPLPFLAPPFYELDFSEVPVMICGFLYGPVAGVLVELVKIILKVLIKGTSTAFVGDFANFAVGCSLVIPAAAWYQGKKNKKNAVIAMVLGTAVMTVFGTLFNGVYLLPKFAQLYGMPLDQLIAMGTAINGGIHNIVTFVIIAVAPINLVKGAAVTVIVTMIYKPVSRAMHRIP
ncbi:MAG: ECF transporter S component [Lachnospiraceae bacterium]|nr:ECF transporter S component [Candidatus Fimimorpha excrementavium]